MDLHKEFNKVVDEYPVLLNIKYSNDAIISDNVLAQAFRAISFDLNISQTLFCKQNNISRTNFSRWMGLSLFTTQNDHSNKSSKDAVIKIISDIFSNRYNLFEDNNIVCHPIKVWRKHVFDLKPKTIAFIDADNSRARMCADINILFCNHVAFCRIIKEDTSNHYVYETMTGCKDAADVALSMEISLFNEIMPIDVEFIMVTMDDFAREVMARITHGGGRKCTLMGK